MQETPTLRIPRTHAEKYAPTVEALRKMKSVEWARIVGKYLYVCTKSDKLRYSRVLRPGQRKYLSSVIIRVNLVKFVEKEDRPYYCPVAMKYRWPWAQEHPVLRHKLYLSIGRVMFMAPCLGDFHLDYKKALREKGLKAAVEVIIHALQSIEK